MKTFLTTFFVIALLSLNNEKSFAQCTVSDIVIQNVKVIGSTSTSCTVMFDVTFNIEDNFGNKFIFIHAWLQDEYPNYFKCVNGQTTVNGSIAAPGAADLVKSFLNIGINNDGATPFVLSAYPPDASVPMATINSIEKVVHPDGSATITLKGVIATSPVACTTPVVIVADLWSSQSATAQRAHCVNCGISYSAGYLNVTGFVNCTNHIYSGTITNNTAIQIDGYYKVYADINGDGYFTPATDTLLQNSITFTVGANSTISISGPVPAENINQDLFIVITQTSGAASGASRVILFPSSQCGALPVNFRSLTASRINRANVLLKWETTTEINNSGFTVQRNIDNYNWESVSFIPTQAQGGNSNIPLTYTFNDLNSNTGMTQYRIKQQDKDGKISLSRISAVRGEAQKTKTIVYPNPVTNGHFNVVFEDKERTYDISLTDMNGRTLKQWKAVTNNTLRIENLGTGMYLLKVITRETGNQSFEKIIVQ
ncbi:MAG TPA: T9SS type A sorting domain-containing protein [Chitinophagaceae bacterium]|nr:T9SS type A sorting domain-containing protein [Chitinophagaceae bacterium]